MNIAAIDYSLSLLLPNPEVRLMSIAQPPPANLYFMTEGQWIVRLHKDGRIEVRPGIEPDEAAKAFIRAV